MIKFVKKNKDFIFMIIILAMFCGMLAYFGKLLDKHLTDINYTEMVGRWND